MLPAGIFHSQVPALGHGGRPFGSQPLSFQPSEPRCQLVVRSGQPANRSTCVSRACPRALRPSCPRIMPPSQSSGFPMLPPLSSASHYTQYSILDTRAFTFALLHAAPPHLHLCTVSCPPALVSSNYAPQPIIRFPYAAPFGALTLPILNTLVSCQPAN